MPNREQTRTAKAVQMATDPALLADLPGRHTLQLIADFNGIHLVTLRRALKRAGVPMRPAGRPVGTTKEAAK